MSAHWSDKLVALHACSEAVAYARAHKSLAAAWRNCERGDWMLWLAGRLSGAPDSASRRKLVGAAADCAALALPIFEARYPNNKRVRECIEACRRYAAGEIDMAELRKYRAYSAAYAAAATAATAAPAYAAAATAAATDAAAYSAYADDAAYSATDAAAYAAYAAYASAAYADDAAYAKMRRDCADVVRKHYPRAPRL